MFKSLPGLAKYLLGFLVIFLLVFILFSVSVAFLSFPLSKEEVVSHFNFNKGSNIADASEVSDSIQSPFGDLAIKDFSESSSTEYLRNRVSSESQEVKRYFEGPKFYEEIGGEKNLVLIEGIVDSVNLDTQVVSIKHWDFEEVVDIASADTDGYHLIFYNQDGSTSESEASFSSINVGDHISYNVANPRRGLDFSVWVIVR